jgi:hypothetical protein
MFRNHQIKSNTDNSTFTIHHSQFRFTPYPLTPLPPVPLYPSTPCTPVSPYPFTPASADMPIEQSPG